MGVVRRPSRVRWFGHFANSHKQGPGLRADDGNQFANNVVFTFVSERVRMNARTRWVLKGSTMSRPSELEANSSFAVLMVDVRRSIDFENSVAFTPVVQVL